MIMDLTVTPTSNVDHGKLKDQRSISHFHFNKEQEVLVFDRTNGKEVMLRVNEISMWLNELIVGGVNYEVLRIFSKPIYGEEQGK